MSSLCLHRRAWSIVALLAFVALASPTVRAVANGVPLQPVVAHSVFGAALGVGNTLMEHDGRVNFALRLGGSEANIDLSRMAADATVVRAFLFWGGTFDAAQGIPLDRDVDLTLPSGALFNNLSVDTLVAGEPASALSRCVSRDHIVSAGQTQPMYVCRREITFLLQQLGPGGAVGVYSVDDVDLKAGDCDNEPGRCQVAYGGFGVVVMWESATEPVRRDLVLSDGFFALDEQGTQGGFSSGIGPIFDINGFTIGPSADGELTIMAFEGDSQLGVPPQNIPGNSARCTDGRCEDFVQVRTNGNPTFTRLQDVTNRPGNLLNGSSNQGGVHPGLDIDTFDLGPSGLDVLRAGDTQLSLQAGSGDGVGDNGSGGSGELFLLGYTLLSVETLSPRFLNTGTEKVVLEPIAGVGEVLNYLLRVENDGSAAATNAVLRDQLPAGTTYQVGSTSNTCGVSSADVGGTSPVLTAAGLLVGTLAVGERCEVRLRVTIDGDVVEGSVLDNFFTLAADDLPAILVGPATTVVQSAELGRPTKSVAVLGGGAPAAGSTLVYTVRIANTGGRSVTGVSLLDVLPPQLEALQVLATPSGSSNASTATTLDIRDIAIAATSTVDVIFLARIRLGTASGTAVANQGSVEQPSLPAPLLTDDANTAAAVDPTTVVVAAGLSLAGSTKSVAYLDFALLEPGDVLEFRVTALKTGPTASIVTLSDDLPANVGGCVVVSAPLTGFLACSAGGANGTGRLDGAVVMNAEGSADFVFRVTVNAAATDGTVIVNTARLVPLADPAFALDVSSPPLTVFARPLFVASSKTVLDVNGGDARPNDVLRYTVTAQNTGSLAASAVVITDAVPAGLVNVTPLDGGVLGAGGGNGTISWTLASPLAAGASALVRFEAGIAPGTVDGTLISNSAIISASAPAQPFTTAPAAITVRSTQLLVVTKTVADLSLVPAGQFRPGDTVRYTLVIDNQGDGTATGVVVRDAIDASFEVVVLTGGGRVEASGGAVAGALVGDLVFDSATTAALASIAPGAQVSLSFDARLLGALANGTIVANQARTTSLQVPAPVLSNDPTTAAVFDATTFAVTSQALLAIDKTFVDDNSGALLPGDVVTYALAVSNTGDAPATNVVISDVLDARLTFVSASDGGSVSGVLGGSGGTVSFPAFTLAPGPARTLTLRARIGAPLLNGSTIDNQASATSPDAALVVSDDPSTAAPFDPTRVVVTSRPVFDTTSKVVSDLDGASDAGAFEPGDRVRYIVVVRNSGSEEGVNVVVTDAVPAELQDIVVGQGGALVGGTATWALGTVAVGAAVTLTLEGDVRRPLADALVVVNQAVVTASDIAATFSDDPATAVLGDATRFNVTSKPRLVIDKSVIDDNGGSVEPGDLLRYLIHIDSEGGRDALDITLTDIVDRNLVGVVALDGGALAGNGSGAGPAPGATASTLTWTFPSLAIDTSAEVHFTAIVALPLANGTLIDNQASAVLAEPAVPGAPFVSDDPATAAALDVTRVQVVSAGDLAATTLETADAAGTVIAIAAPNQDVRYLVEVRNRGNAPSNNVTVTLGLPVDAFFVAAVSAGGVGLHTGPLGDGAGGTVTFTSAGAPALALVAPGDVVSLVVTVRLRTPLDDGVLVSAQALLGADGVVAPFVSDDPSSAGFGDATVLEIDSAPLLAAFDKAVSDDNGAPAEPGDVMSFALSVQNDGDAIARGVTLSDALPPELELVDAGGGTATGTGAGTTLTFALGDLAPGQRVTRTVRARVLLSVANGAVVANQAFIDADNDNVPAPGGASDDPATAVADDATRFTVVTVPRLRVSKDVDVRVAAPGDTLSYTIVVTSAGSAPAPASALVDVIATTLTDVVVAPGGSGAVFDIATGEVRASFAALAVGAVESVTFTARVADTVVNGTQIANQARVSGLLVPLPEGDALSDDPATAAPGDATVVVIDATAFVTLQKTATDLDGPPLLPGDAVRWDLTVTNAGIAAARDVRVTDAVDARLLITNVGQQGAQSGAVLAWEPSTTPALAVLGRGRAVTLTFTTSVIAAVGDGARIDNQASLVSLDVSGVVPSDDPATAAADATTIVVQAPVLVLEKRFIDLNEFGSGGGTLAAGLLEPGDAIEYDIEVRNDGSVTASGIEITDVLSSVLTAVEVLDGGVNDSGLVRWTVPSLAPGGRQTVRLRATIDPFAVGGAVVSNSAEGTAVLGNNAVSLAVRSDDPDTAAVGDATVRVVAAAEIFTGTVELLDGRSPQEGGGAPLGAGNRVVPGQRVRARVTVRNEGTQTAQAVVLRVPLQPLRFVADETSEGGVLESGPTGAAARWDASQTPALLQLEPGEVVVVELEGAVASPIADELDIEVEAFATSVGTAVPVSIGSALMSVRSRADLSATTKEVIDEDGGLVEPGDLLRYRMTVINDGGSLAKDVRIIDAIPGGTAYVPSSTRVRAAPVGDAAASAAPTIDGLAIGDIDAGRSAVVEFHVRVSPSAPRGLRIDNQAVLHAQDVADAVSDNPGTPLILGDATPVIVGGGPSLVVHKVALTTPATLGEPLHFLIHVENVGTEPALDIVIEDVIADVATGSQVTSASFIAGSLVVDGAALTDESDRDDAEADIARRRTLVRARRDVLEAGDGFTFAFQVRVNAGDSVNNQATVASKDGTLLSDGDPGLPGAQPTIVPVRGARGLVIEQDALSLVDDNGGALDAGDRVTVRAVIKNRSLEDVLLTDLAIGASVLLAVDAASLADGLAFDVATRTVSLAAGPAILVQAGDTFDVVFKAHVSAEANIGEVVRAIGDVVASSIDGQIVLPTTLGRAQLTVGLLPGTGALEGTMFLDSGAHDGLFDPGTSVDEAEPNSEARDEPARGITVLAFWRDEETPVQTAICDDKGRYRLLPIPAGRYRLELRSPGGAFLGDIAAGQLASGEVRERDVPIEATGAVYLSGAKTGRTAASPATGARVFLFVDDGDRDPSNDVLVSPGLLGDDQQGQPVSLQGLYRFDVGEGRYRIGVETPDPLTVFPSTHTPVAVDPAGDPSGPLAQVDADGNVVAAAVPRAGALSIAQTRYFLRFAVVPGAPRLQHNFLPVDRLQSQLLVTKTATRKRASIGDLIGYTVRVENRALAGVSLSEGGVEIVDALPLGLKLVAGSYRLDRIKRDARGQEQRSKVAVKDEGGRIRTFGPFALEASAAYELRYNVVVTPLASFGVQDNRAALRLAAGQVALSEDALASVHIVPDGTFDLGTIRAKVWCDDDGDGWHDAGEPGLPGAALYVDTGQWAQVDIEGKAHFSAMPGGMHVVKLDERTLPPGTVVSEGPRRTVYMSAGAPAQVSFAARCAFVSAGKAEIVVNEAAYRPADKPNRKLTLATASSPATLVVTIDGAAPRDIALPVAELGVAVTGLARASMAGGIDSVAALAALAVNAPARRGALAGRLVFAPHYLGPAPSSWMIVIDGPLTPIASEPPLAVAAAAAWTPLWNISGTGLPPAQVLWDGHDPQSRAAVLREGALYRATLLLGLEGGDLVRSPSRMFGVAAGVPLSLFDSFATGDASTELDSSAGELFTPTGEPTARLTSWLQKVATNVRGAAACAWCTQPRVSVIVHASEGPGTLQAITAKRAAAVKQLLVSSQVQAALIDVRGAGDSAPKVPNLRQKDRAKNRRVQIVVTQRAPTPPPLAPLAAVSPELLVGGASITALTDGAFRTEIELSEGEPLSVHITSSNGAVVKLMDALRSAAPPATAVPVEVKWAPADDALVAGGAYAVDTSLLKVRVRGVRIEGPLVAAQRRAGSSKLERETARRAAQVDVLEREPPSLVFQTEGPAVEVLEWRLLLTADGPNGPRTRADFSGQGAVPAEVRWDGIDVDGQPVRAGDMLSARLSVTMDTGDSGTSPEVTVQLASTSGASSSAVPAVALLIEATREAESLYVNGAVVEQTDGVFVVPASPTASGELALELRDAAGARASVHVYPAAGNVVMSAVAAGAASHDDAAAVAPQDVPLDLGEALEPERQMVAKARVPRPAWWPQEESLAAASLQVELPADTSALRTDRLLVRGTTSPSNKLRITAGGTSEAVAVDALTGNFVHVAKLREGDSDVVIEATDDKGNVGRLQRRVSVDTTGWFALALADTAFGGEGADLAERTPYTSLTLGDTFLYGRGAAFVKGKWRGPFLFADYDLTLHLDTRRWQDDVFAPELIDPERFFPLYGDSSVENSDALRSGFPLYLDLKADSSSLVVGNVRTEMIGADLFRYQRARAGAQLVFDRGWAGALEVPVRAVTGEVSAAPSPEGDAWRTRVTGFVAGGGGQRHARAELLGTGSSVYFLRHERVVEGSERVALIVRDGVTGAVIGKKTMVRDVDYSVRYLEGRVMFKEPIGAFSDFGGSMTNQNLGQVVSSNRVFVEVEYEHQDDDPFMGFGAGAHARQTLAGHAELGGGYVYEAREGGEVGYQLGGAHLRVYLDEATWLQGELLRSQSIDAGNFVSFDGGLTYASLGQSLDASGTSALTQGERAGGAFKIDGQAQLGALLGQDKASAVVHAYVQQQEPGFFAGAAIVEQGQTKWGADSTWQVIKEGRLKLRYDGVISDIPEFANLTRFRTLHREVATLRYEHRLSAPLLLAGEYGYGYTADSGSFANEQVPSRAPFHTNVVAAGLEWQVIEALSLSLRQEAALSGDPNQLQQWNDHLITHLALKVAINEDVSLHAGTSARWNGENQVHAGLSLGVNETSRVYLTERVGLLPAPITGTMAWRSTTIVGGESELAPGSKAYAEYQLDGGLSGEQSRGVIGTKTSWTLPWGFALQFGYERIMLLGGAVAATENGNIPPAAFTDGTFYAAPGANGGGSYLGGEGSRDALSTAVAYQRGDSVVASQRFELRYDDQSEGRGGHDRLWFLSGTAGAIKMSAELSLLARYNIALAHDLALAAREAYFEEGAFGVAYRPVTHDWLSVLAKISRRVDIRPLSLEGGVSDDYTAHALSVEPIVELPWKIQLVQKLALKHASQRLGDTPEANAVTGLFIHRLNLHTLGLMRSLGLEPFMPGELDLGVEHRLLVGMTYGSVAQGPLVELQIAPIDNFRFGLGYNWTRFSDDELDSGSLDRSGFFVRAVGTF